MAGDGVAAQNVFFLGTTADVVDDERLTLGIVAVGSDADVYQAFAQIPSDDVASLEAAVVNLKVMALKIATQIGHTSVVDVGIGLGQIPKLGIGRKMLTHVFMHQLL